MQDNSIPVERILFGNEHWRSHRATEEIKVYCNLLDDLQERIDALHQRGTAEESAYVNAKAVISSYALEIGIKSLWALDNPDEKVKQTHNLLWFFGGLNNDTEESLKRIGLTEEVFQKEEPFPQFDKPFQQNRYSMESGNRYMVVYETDFLRNLANLVGDKLQLSSGEAALRTLTERPDVEADSSDMNGQDVPD